MEKYASALKFFIFSEAAGIAHLAVETQIGQIVPDLTSF
jgi:hypothetical protein